MLDIHLEIVESEGIESLSQVREKRTSRFLPEVEVRLLKAQRTIEVRKADSLAAFRFSSVPKGRFPSKFCCVPRESSANAQSNWTWAPVLFCRRRRRRLS